VILIAKCKLCEGKIAYSTVQETIPDTCWLCRFVFPWIYKIFVRKK
jgi:hypothetical protein